MSNISHQAAEPIIPNVKFVGYLENQYVLKMKPQINGLVDRACVRATSNAINASY